MSQNITFSNKKIYWYILFLVLFIYLFSIDIIFADAELVVAIALLIMLTLLYNKATDPVFMSLNKDIYVIYQLIYNNIVLFKLSSSTIININSKFINLIQNFKYYFLNLYEYDNQVNLKLTKFINPIKSLIRQELNLLLTFELKFLETLFKSHLFYSLYNAKQYLNCSYLYKMFNDPYYLLNILHFGSIYAKNINDPNIVEFLSKKQFKQILLGFFLNETFLHKLNYDK